MNIKSLTFIQLEECDKFSVNFDYSFNGETKNSTLNMHSVKSTSYDDFIRKVKELLDVAESGLEKDCKSF